MHWYFQMVGRGSSANTTAKASGLLYGTKERGRRSGAELSSREFFFLDQLRRLVDEKGRSVEAEELHWEGGWPGDDMINGEIRADLESLNKRGFVDIENAPSWSRFLAYRPSALGLRMLDGQR